MNSVSRPFPFRGTVPWLRVMALTFLTSGLVRAEDAPKAPVAKYPDHNPIASTGVLSKRVGGRSQELSGSVAGAKKLYLVVVPTEKYITENNAAWSEPRLVGPAGMKKLTELTPTASANEGGPAVVNKTMAGRPLLNFDQPVEYGFGVSAPSILEFEIPEGYAQFITTVSVDPMNPEDPNVKASVRFKIFTDLPGDASQFPELEAREKEREKTKVAAEQARLQLKAKSEVSEARKKLQRAEQRFEMEKQRLAEEKKHYEETLKAYPGVKVE